MWLIIPLMNRELTEEREAKAFFDEKNVLRTHRSGFLFEERVETSEGGRESERSIKTKTENSRRKAKVSRIPSLIILDWTYALQTES